MCGRMTDDNLQKFINDVNSAHTDYDKFGKSLLDMKKINLAVEELEAATGEFIKDADSKLNTACSLCNRGLTL